MSVIGNAWRTLMTYSPLYLATIGTMTDRALRDYDDWRGLQVGPASQRSAKSLDAYFEAKRRGDW